MVYIPLLIGLKTQTDQARLHLLGIVMVWSFAPLIPQYQGCAIKNLFILAQICWLPTFLGELNHSM